jgi:hypothetical protein
MIKPCAKTSFAWRTLGYDYCFYLSVNDPERFIIYKDDAIRLHNQLKDRDWFPVFGQCEHSGSGGYGVASVTLQV